MLSLQHPALTIKMIFWTFFLNFIDVAPTGKIAIDWALQRKAKDFEDYVQYYAALRTGADYIVSRNVRDYPFDDIPVVTPQDFLIIMGFE